MCLCASAGVWVFVADTCIMSDGGVRASASMIDGWLL